MSARTIIAAPVIWFGSWLLSVMACSGCAVASGFFRFRVVGNKKGPQRPHAHRLNLGWPQPPPAVRLGTTTIRSLVIILRIRQLGLPKGCAVIPPSPRKSREGRIERDFWSVTVFRALGEWDFYACSHAGRQRNPGPAAAERILDCAALHSGYGRWASTHPRAASGFTHS